MRKPDESLDDYVVRELEIQVPPRRVSLRFTGEVEVLKPLAVWAPPPVKAAGLSWFHRSLVAGGAFALIAVVLGSAVFIGMYESQPEMAQVDRVDEVAQVDQVEEFVSPDGNLLTEELPADVFTTTEPEDRAIATPRRFRRAIRPAYSTFAVRNSSFKQRRVRRPIAPLVSAFVPTTLIIYIDKGEVKSRIEPQLTAGYKKTPTLSN